VRQSARARERFLCVPSFPPPMIWTTKDDDCLKRDFLFFFDFEETRHLKNAKNPKHINKGEETFELLHSPPLTL